MEISKNLVRHILSKYPDKESHVLGLAELCSELSEVLLKYDRSVKGESYRSMDSHKAEIIKLLVGIKISSAVLCEALNITDSDLLEEIDSKARGFYATF